MSELSQAKDSQDPIFAPHQQRVAANFPPHSVAHKVALYHDHLEDGLGEVPREVYAHVEVLTRRDTEPYFDYIRRVRDSRDRVAIAVKRADLFDNLARCLGQFDGTPNTKRGIRYERALEMLS